MSYWTILTAVAPVFLIVAVGWVLRWRNIMVPEAENSFARLVILVLYPAFLFSLVLGSPAFDKLGEIALAPVMGAACIIIGMVVAWWLAPLFGEGEVVRRRTFGCTAGVFNFGYIAIPVTAALFPKALYPETLTVLVLFNMGVDFAIWSFGVVLLTGEFRLAAIKRAFNPPVLGILAGSLLTIAGLDAYLPAFLLETLEMVGACAIPIGILLIGATLHTLMKGMPWLSYTRTMVGAVSMRLLLIPLLFWGMVWLLPLGDDLQRVILVQAAMPCGIFVLMMTKVFNGNPRTALLVIVATNAIGFFTIPLWLKLGLWLFPVQ